MRRSSLIAALALAGCAADVGSASPAIVNGTRETGHPEVVLLYRLDGAACTGAIIAPRVVLTAYHCVQGRTAGSVAPASAFRIYVGSSQRQLTAEYRVSAVRPVPDAVSDFRTPNDVALLELTQDADVTPLEIGLASPFDILGQTSTAVGFGQTPSGSSGTKYSVATRVEDYFSGFLYVAPTVCQGDSGGPLIGPDGRVYGVASFIVSADGMTEPQCGTAPGIYNEIYRHLEFIASVTGDCVPSGEEICNGLDDDCANGVDDGCTPIGGACTDGSTCVGGVCANTDAGHVCSSPCDPLRPDQGCAPGFFCSSNGLTCDGFCVPGGPGERGNGEECTRDTDCDSLVCVDPGNGVKRCLDPCRGGAGLCIAGEACAAAEGGCGACVPPGILFGVLRGLGEPCQADEDCAGGICNERGGLRECSTACDASTACPEGFWCSEGRCLRDQRQSVGGICLDALDCPGNVCASQGTRQWCTNVCSAATDCPASFDCVAAGGTRVCAPTRALDGEACDANDDCITGLCAATGGGSVCARFCDARNACPPGLACQRTADRRTAVCIRPTPAPRTGGGCNVSTVSYSSGGLAWLVALALGLARRRCVGRRARYTGSRRARSKV